MLTFNSIEKKDYLLTSEIASEYRLELNLLFRKLEEHQLVYTYNSIKRLTQKAIKLGASYRITKFSKNIIWPKDSLNEYVLQAQSNQSLNTLDQENINYIYHMTHIDNLQSILNYGLFPHLNDFQKIDISDCDVNNRRSRLEPLYKKSIHSYVPFYFNPKNAMLYVRKNIQDNIVIIKLKRDLLLNKHSLFTDGNASCSDTKFYKDLVDLNKLNWECINDNNWCNHIDGRRIKMAEVLVPEYVGVDNIVSIICNNTLSKLHIEKLKSNVEVYLDEKNKFYF